MVLESAFCLIFSFKLVIFTKSYARKQKWLFFSEHSVDQMDIIWSVNDVRI